MAASRRRLLLLTKGSRVNPASRYRFLSFIPALEAAGFDVTVEPFFDDRWYALRHQGASRSVLGPYALSRIARRLALAAGLRRGQYDLVAVENQVVPYEPGLGEALLSRAGIPFTIEFDDAIYRTPLHRGKLLRTMAAARRVIVGNAHLATFARQATNRVDIAPSVIDLDRYPVDRSEPPEDRFVVTWIGLPYNYPYLHIIEPALQRLARRIPLTFRVISAGGYALSGVEVDFRPWSEAGEASLLASSHVGVMPLPDNEYERGKCGLKLLQYLAAGRGSVSSPVGVNRDIVRHGENGYLAWTSGQWEEQLLDLWRRPELRRAMGAAGRRTVEESYSLAVWGPRVAALYHRIIDET